MSRRSAFAAVTGLGGKPPLPGPLADGRAPLQAISARQTEMANAALIRNNNDWNSWITGYQDGGFGDWGILRTRQKPRVPTLVVCDWDGRDFAWFMRPYFRDFGVERWPQDRRCHRIALLGVKNRRQDRRSHRVASLLAGGDGSECGRNLGVEQTKPGRIDLV